MPIDLSNNHRYETESNTEGREGEKIVDGTNLEVADAEWWLGRNKKRRKTKIIADKALGGWSGGKNT